MKRRTAPTYRIVRFFRDPEKINRVMKRGLTLAEAQAHCRDPKTSSREGDWRTWFFDGYEEEPRRK